jgi:peptidoglycan/xylan/chitin deacetylase (PgdA/CDA1 family)
MTVTALKSLAIVAALLVGGTSLALIGFLGAPQIITRQTSAPKSAPADQHATPADQLVSEIGAAGTSGTAAAPVATVQESQPGAIPSAGPTQNESATNSAGPTTNAIRPCDKPDGLGLSRLVQIDTTGGPRFGSIQHPEGDDFLRDKEVVLTFDDGPRPGSTEAVVKALTDECLRATFFEVGQMASWHPEVTKQLIDAGMTVGTHTWSHKDLARIFPEKAEQQIEMANSAVSAAAGGKIAPFFRFPYLAQPPRILSYLADRNIAIFSGDIDSRDYTMHEPEPVVDSVMSQLEKRGKGIVLMHDIHPNTAEALPALLRQLKATGFKVVHMVPKEQLTTIAKYDEMLDHRKNVSSKAQPVSASAPGRDAATRHSIYMYVPPQGRKGAPMTGTTGAH